MTGSIAPNRPGHHGTVVARTVGTVAISCNVCAPWVTRCSLGKYWSRDWFRGNFSLTQDL